VISAEEAVRRVLMLENPGLPGKSSMTLEPVRRAFS
jgi:gentisate 1,2-dioxygenase